MVTGFAVPSRVIGGINAIQFGGAWIALPLLKIYGVGLRLNAKTEGRIRRQPLHFHAPGVAAPAIIPTVTVFQHSPSQRNPRVDACCR